MGVSDGKLMRDAGDNRRITCLLGLVLLTFDAPDFQTVASGLLSDGMMYGATRGNGAMIKLCAQQSCVMCDGRLWEESAVKEAGRLGCSSYASGCHRAIVDCTADKASWKPRRSDNGWEWCWCS